MSVLTDRETLLLQFQLNYLRLSNIHHSLNSLPSRDVLEANPFVAASGLCDSPELAPGRESPPLGSRAERRLGALSYSATIGKVGATAGMRVEGRVRPPGWKRRTAAQTASGEMHSGVQPPSNGEVGIESETDVTTTEAETRISRRNSLEASIHHRRMAGKTDLPPAAPPPPPVVISSPVRTLSSAHPSPDLSPPRHADSSSSLSASDEFAPPHLSSSPLPSSPVAVGSLAAHYTSVPPDVHHSAPTDASSAPLPDDTMVERFEEDNYAETEEDGSLASSGVSLFGLSRRTPSTSEPSALLSRSSPHGFAPSASDASPASDPSQITNAGPSSPEHTTPQLPMTILRVRPTRERRRVNISGRMLVPIAEPPNEDTSTVAHSSLACDSSSREPMSALEHQHHAPHQHANPQRPETTLPLRPRSNTDPPRPPAQQLPSSEEVTLRLSEDHGALAVRRKVSAPSLLPGRSSFVSSPLQSFTVDALVSTPSQPSPISSTPARRVILRSQHSGRLVFNKVGLASQTSSPPSALTSLFSTLSSSTAAPNPFAQLYASLLSRPGDPSSLPLTLFFPSSSAATEPLRVVVRKDICVEEVVGVGLYSLWQEGRFSAEPSEEQGDVRNEGTERWNLRIVEDEDTGEVDDDFPALDRTRAIGKFGFGVFAVVKATAQQVQDNVSKQASILRRPSRILAPMKMTTHPTPPSPAIKRQRSAAEIALAPPSTSQHRLGATIGVSSALAIPVLLKVQLPPVPGVERVETTVSVPNDMYISDVLELLCKKRNLDNSKEWMLVVQHNDRTLPVPLDRTVDSLGENHTLALVRRPNEAGLYALRPGLVNTNPSASIFKRLSEPPQPRYVSATDATSGSYLTYQVQRKLPMPLGRHPRTIALDGDYVHFLPSESTGRTSSFHISHVIECKVSRRSPSSFKLVVGQKRYDFEADSVKVAAEIVGNVKATLERWKEPRRV